MHPGQTSDVFRCVLIGADSLLVQCGEILLAKGHKIQAVITGTDRISRWAREQSIRILDPASDYPARLASDPFDYLFSITHLAILPDEVLALPRKGAINFHDGPLPTYAGLNTPAWALIRGETTYGITWHQMTSGVDRGDILRQQLFEIAADETSLSLNTRCFQAAIETFGPLVDDLARGQATPQPQPAGERNYFGKHQRPEAACMIDWQRPASELAALVRALDFGRYANPLGLAKVGFAGQLLAVTRATVEQPSADNYAAKPGEILSVEEETLRVATGDGVLSISGLAALTGQPLTIGEAAEKLKLASGCCFDTISADLSQKLTELSGELARSEAFWVQRLAALQAADVPYRTGEQAEPNDAGLTETTFDVPGAFRQRFGNDAIADALLSAFGAYLARCGDKTHFDLAFADDALRGRIAGCEAWASAHSLVRLQVNLDEGFHNLRSTVTAELALARKQGTWMNDAIGRFPELQAKPELVAGNAMPVAVVQGTTSHSHSDLTLCIDADGQACRFVYDPRSLTSDAVASIQRQLVTFLEGLAAEPDRPLGQVELLSPAQRQRMLVEWNDTAADYPREACIHHLIEAQASRTPNDVAVVCEGQSLTYRELNERANRLAAHLRSLGIGPDRLVGVCVDRSLDLMISILGTLKAGGAYVPLDPAYPADRIAHMIEDSAAPVILTQERLVPSLPRHSAHVVRIDADWPVIANHSTELPRGEETSSNLAYVIYTSGSTGKPKGVMVEHRNVVNFFRGMDDRIAHDPPGVWLAVTSLSFDISVLELFWTLARGFKVVLYVDRDRQQTATPPPVSSRGMDFGLFMWGNDDAEGRRKYELMLEGAKFFDENGFDSVWTPERHFHAFGGPYPNPSVTGAAIAAVTSRVKIRAGSCVSPLHHPIRIAEEWAVVDNISDGRVGIAFAAGWMPNDFVIRPENHKNNKQIMVEQIDTVRRLWRGEELEFSNPMGQQVKVTTLPRPVQKELPVWVTTAGNPDTYRQAAAQGANVLTHLLGQSVEEVAEKIRIYRDALEENGRDRDSGKVTLMLHTFVGVDDDAVREIVRGPMKDYLGSSVSLVKNFAWAFPAFKRPKGQDATPADIDLSTLTAEELDAILDHAFERYFVNSGLFGTPETCLRIVEKLKAIGVDEIACLLDFGVPTEQVMESLPRLKIVRDQANPAVHEGNGAAQSNGEVQQDHSLPALIRHHNVTHLQCTPSMARMLVTSDETRAALKTIQHFMVGGEAFPVDLGKQLDGFFAGTVTNMYGPTETTIWSTTQRVEGGPDTIPIGRPIANTQLYILDERMQPTPPGVPGEFYIAGDGVVRGYLNRPELTAERFLDDPFHAGPGARMYRTGDLARYRPDGVVEFLGRTDHQVKVRGYRIELGEIETNLNRHPGVKNNVVVAREDTPGDQRLVAYLIAQSSPPDAAELREHLRQTLPEYMLPAHYVFLDELPLTPNGKIDRKALPAPDANRTRTETEYAPPENELEKTVSQLWQETLGLDRIGIDDNFFDIGGHSLLVVRLHRSLSGMVDRAVALTDLYRFPTVRTLTAFLNSDDTNGNLQKSVDRAERRRAAAGRRRRQIGTR